MAYIEPGLYTIHWAANPTMVMSVKHDWDDENVKMWSFPYENPADGQIWRVVSAVSGSTDQMHIVNVMSGKALCLPPLSKGYYDEWIAAIQNMYSSGSWSSWNSIVSKYPNQMSQLTAAILGNGHTVNDLYYAVGAGKKDDTPAGVAWGSVDSTRMWNAMQALKAGESKYANGTEPVQATLAPRDNRFRWVAGSGILGGTASWDGKTYARYTLRSAVAGGMIEGNPDFALLCNDGFASSAMEKIVVWADNAFGSNERKAAYVDLIFVPFEHGVPAGTYEIATPDGTVVGLSNETRDNGAKVTLVAGSGTATRKASAIWRIKEGAQEGISNLQNMHSGSWLSMAGYTGDSIEVYQWDAAPGEGDIWGNWLIEPMSSVDAGHENYGDGTLYHPFRFRPEGGSQMVLSYGVNSSGRYLLLTNIETTPAPNTRFILRPVDPPAMQEVGSASDIAVSLAKGGIAVAQSTFPQGGTLALWASWLHQPQAKLRWRIVTELPEAQRPTVRDEAGYTTPAAPGLWFSLDGSTANDGLGDKAGPGFEAEQIGGRCWAPKAIELECPESLAKPFEVQIGVRGVSTEVYADETPATGPEIVATVKLFPPVEATATGCTWSPDGLRVGYSLSGSGGEASLGSSHFVRVESVSIGGSEILLGPEALEDAPASGFVTVPVSSLTAIPGDGASATVVLASGQTFGAEGRKTAAVRIAYAADHGTMARPSMTRQGGYTVRVSLAGHGSAKVWYQVGTDDGTRFAYGDEVSDGVFECYPPLNVRCRVYAVVEDGESWSTYTGWLPTVAGDGTDWEMVNWAGGWFRLRFDPSESYSVEHSYETVSPDGRDYQPVIFTGPKTERITLSGFIFEDASEGHDTFADFGAAVRAHHVVYRSPYGRWCRAAVVGASSPRQYTGRGEVSLELVREDA